MAPPPFVTEQGPESIRLSVPVLRKRLVVEEQAQEPRLAVQEPRSLGASGGSSPGVQTSNKEPVMIPDFSTQTFQIYGSKGPIGVGMEAANAVATRVDSCVHTNHRKGGAVQNSFSAGCYGGLRKVEVQVTGVFYWAGTDAAVRGLVQKPKTKGPRAVVHVDNKLTAVILNSFDTESTRPGQLSTEQQANFIKSAHAHAAVRLFV